MASSPGLSTHLTEGQFSHHRNNSNNATNGSSRGVRFQNEQDAIVPASDQDDNNDDDDDISTDEDEAYNSYMQEQEQQQNNQQQIKQNLGLTRQMQSQYGSRDHDMDEDDGEDGYTHYRQHQQQPHHHQHQQLRQIQQQYQLQQQQHLNAYKSQAMNIQQLLRQDQSQDHDMAGTDSHEEDEYYQKNPHHNPHLQHQMGIDMQQGQHHDLSDGMEDDDDFDDDIEEEVDEEMMDEEEEGSDAISLTEEDIDFNLVYAFHTFVATQEGQASVTPFERLARLNTYRNVSLTAPSPEYGTFDEHIQPLDPALLEQRASNRRSVVFTAQNEFLEASETEWTDEEDEEAGWYVDGEEDGEEEELEEEEAVVDDEHDEEGEPTIENVVHGTAALTGNTSLNRDEIMDSNCNQGHSDTNVKSNVQLQAESVQQDILNDQKKHGEMLAKRALEQEQESSRPSQQTVEDDDNESEDEEVQVTNRYRKPLLDDDDFFSSEKRVISLTPPIARDDSPNHRESPTQSKNVRLSSDTTSRQSPQPSQQLQPSSLQSQRQLSPSTLARSPSFDSDEEDRELKKKQMAERKEAKITAILGNGPQEPIVRKSKEEYERGLPPEAVVVKKPGKFKSLFSVGKSSKDKEKKEKERLEKERLKNQAKSASSPTGSSSSNSGISNNLFRTRSNSNGSVGSSNLTQSSSSVAPPSPTVAKKEDPQSEFITLRVYPGNVDFGASMYKTVVVTPSTMASDVAHQAVVKFRLAPDGTASTGDFYLTVKGVDGDETVLQATDKPMAIYQSLTAHLTTPLPPNHRLSISSVSSMMSVNSTGSQGSNSSPAMPGTPTLRRTGSGKNEPHQRSIRFLLNKKIKRAGSISAASTSMPSTPTTPTAPLDDFFWVKVVCQAQDLPQSMVLLEGMGSAMEKVDSRTHGQSFATKVEHWIPMHSTSNAGDVIFKTLEKVGIRSGVVDGVPEHVLAAKRLAVPHGLVIEYQLGLRLMNSATKKLQSEETSLPPQLPLAKCFVDQQLVPIRRSPKADVASMPLHPDYVFFLRKATKSLQAEMKFVQERLQQTQARSRPAPLQSQQPGRNSIDADAQTNGMVSPTSSGFPGRSGTNLGQVNSSAASPPASTNRLTGAASPPIRIPRRTDSVIMSPTSTPVRANSFDNSSGRPSPTLSNQNIMTTQQIHPPQLSRTPTPDRHQHQIRTRSPSISQGSPTSLARPLQAPSPAPSNLSSHGEQHEGGSRSSTPERLAKLDRPERQRAISPSLTHGPSPLSMSAIMLSNDSSNSSMNRKESLTASEQPLSPTPTNRLSVKKNATQGVDIMLQKGIVRSSRSQSQYQYLFIPFGGGEEIDITEIIEDVLGGDSDNEDEDNVDENHSNSTGQNVDLEQDLASMTRRERVAAAVARASQAVAAGKERRKAIASAKPVSAPGVSLRSSPSRDWDRLEQLSGSARGGETLLKLERALAGEAMAGSGSSSAEGASSSRNLPSPMSLNSSSPPSPTHNRRISDAEVQVASVTMVGQNNGLPGSVRNYSPIPQVGTKENDLSPRTQSPNRSSPSTPTSGYSRPILLANVSSLPTNRGTNSNPSSPSSIIAPHLHTIEGRSYSPLPRPLQTPSPAALPHQLSIRTSLASSSSVDPTSSSTDDSSTTSPLGPLPQLTNNPSRSRSASASVAEGGFRKGGHVSSASESAVSSQQQHDPWLLASDYNTGMQDLLTLVRGGRSSSVSTSAPSSLRGLSFGKDGKIIPGPLSPTLSSRHRMLSSQTNSPTSSSSSLYNNTTTNNRHNHHKDTQAHDRHFDDTITTNSSGSNASHNDHVYMTTNNYNTIDEATDDHQNSQSEHLHSIQDDEPRIWVRTDRRLRDVRSECHPEVFECWREVDADLDRVERQLDSLLATVKAAVF
ncbi:hypothetical protein FBU30_011153 [Linnemannia zychae]|nr:hypothetical protein FBU30_011153 [Linnemannia zychae]